MVARCDNGHGRGLGWSWSRNYPTLGEKHRPGTVTVDHQLMMTSVHRDVRYQVLQNLSWILGAPPAVLTKIPVNDRWGDSARTLLSSGCHVMELREGAWTLAQNFGRTVGGF